MVVMDCRDLLTDVSVFLRDTLAHENLSENAQTCRKQLLAKLSTRQTSPPPTPQAYIDMNGGLLSNPKIQHQNCDFYEEFDNSFDKQDKSKQYIIDGYENNMYNNLSTTHEDNIYASNENDTENCTNLKNSAENTYIKPTSALANTPVMPSRLSLPSRISPSNSDSERNSFISLKKDSTDKNSDSSSVTSSSTRCDEAPEVFAMSASALRYTATKCGVLGRREKFLFVEHTKLYWVAALNQTLYMFTTDKDSKPVFQLDIAGYKARPVVVSSNTKTDFKFELVCPGKKTHQFCAEKQSDMEVWISALNAVAVETSLRQLPPLPDVTDGRPLGCEAEYELPSPIPRPVPSTILVQQLEAHFRDRRLSDQSGASERYTRQLMKESRELPLLPHQQSTYDQPDPAAKPVNSQEDYECLREELYHCIPEPQEQKTIDKSRSLPLLPHEHEVYDCPEPTIRPFNPPEPVQEEFYSIIENGTDDNSQEAVYKNIEDEVKTHEVVYKNLNENNIKNEEQDSNYYNVMAYPEAETEQESIYDVISEQRLMASPSPNPPCDEKNKEKTFTVKIPITSRPTVNEELKAKLGAKINPPLVSHNVATIFNKPFVKPNLTVVKPPILNKSFQ